uniref:Histidine kinase domain-containing protein n=1 Tax=Opuntia streptacantha TaxID=393608 RepID=A0A7C9EFK0_OPUST
MLLLTASSPHHSLSNPILLCPGYNPHKREICCPKCLSHSPLPIHHKPLLSLLPLPKSSSPSSSSSIADDTAASAALRYVNDALSEGGDWVPSASAVASAIRKASSSPIEFTQKVERDPKGQGLVLPSPDFQRLCLDQLALFRRIVDPNALLSVYVRPAGSYVMDRLELRRVAYYPTVNGSEIVILVGNFSVPAGLRGAEAALSNQQAEAIPECRAVVFPMVKQPFVVGFLVVELPDVDLNKEPDDASRLPSPEDCYALPPTFDFKSPGITSCSGNLLRYFNLSTDQKLNAINISRSLAMAYVMDQKAMLLQQSSWQNNIRMNNLVEQIRGPLSSVRTLLKMLSVQLKRHEIAHDIVEDIIVQGDKMRDTLQQLQDAVYLTKANIMRFNEESLKRMDGTNYGHPEIRRLELADKDWSTTTEHKSIDSDRSISLSMAEKDLEMPMPPLALAPLQQHNIRPCNVSDVLVDLVGAVELLAQKQKRTVKLSEFSQSLQVSVEEPALRQALGNLIEGALFRTHVGGNVEIVSVGAPAGGALVVIDDDGPDMHYMTQMHSLAPFGAELFSEHMVEDNMTWNFVAGLTVAREILESYGCVVRVISPRNTDAALGAGGTRIEVWLPESTPYNHSGAGAELEA